MCGIAAGHTQACKQALKRRRRCTALSLDRANASSHNTHTSRVPQSICPRQLNIVRMETPGPVNYCHQQRHVLSTLRVHGREDRRTTRVLPARAARIRVVSISTRSIATSKRQWNKTRTKEQPLTCSSRSLDDGTAAPRIPLSPRDITGDG